MALFFRVNELLANFTTYKMNKYKIIFVKNEVIACDLLLSNEIDFDGDYYYEQSNGHPIFAIVKADTVSDAIAMTDRIIKETMEAAFGTTFYY